MPRTNSSSHQRISVSCSLPSTRSHFSVTSGSLHLIFAMEHTGGLRSEHFGSTALRVQEEADQVMDRIESFSRFSAAWHSGPTLVLRTSGHLRTKIAHGGDPNPKGSNID